MPAYLLHVDDLPISTAESLEDAKLEATSYYESKLPLRIEGIDAPGPSRIWRYDYALGAWDEQR